MTDGTCDHPAAHVRTIWQAMHSGDTTSKECLRCGATWLEPYT